MSIPAFKTLKVEIEGQLGRLTLTQPERLNPLGSDTLTEIAEAAHFLDRDRDLKVVVVSGEPSLRVRTFPASARLTARAQRILATTPTEAESWPMPWKT